MYKNNIYIDNHAEVAAMGGDAQYRHWRATVTGVPELLSVPYKNLLIENGFLDAE